MHLEENGSIYWIGIQINDPLLKLKWDCITNHLLQGSTLDLYDSGHIWYPTL